jgi:phage shock protein A
MLPGGSPNQPQLPQQTTAPKSNNNEVVDAELDSLRKQLDQM